MPRRVVHEEVNRGEGLEFLEQRVTNVLCGSDTVGLKQMLSNARISPASIFRNSS
ncbi:MAG TPA: hypothetical protein VNK41_02865 [Vicinamibacterales bacterium]|nr:hypothetical protein [Vicinamibacterales bacterium]